MATTDSLLTAGRTAAEATPVLIELLRAQPAFVDSVTSPGPSSFLVWWHGQTRPELVSFSGLPRQRPVALNALRYQLKRMTIWLERGGFFVFGQSSTLAGQRRRLTDLEREAGLARSLGAGGISAATWPSSNLLSQELACEIADPVALAVAGQ